MCEGKGGLEDWMQGSLPLWGPKDIIDYESVWEKLVLKYLLAEN